eukprot:CAMPEP_0170212662 /NCGR_PEP_ID=MMETSP0116_2-20130129/5949_1 /TAXON_ID=400756 /ORGANISM="Durinskia baltica, Strain CSIRO CS-38" /LENGTH=882 /DNA_ID=CAMNT_0010463201 /DNA_START=91 /DNA_END=2739 /DNA_ORIENTATION=+
MGKAAALSQNSGAGPKAKAKGKDKARDIDEVVDRLFVLTDSNNSGTIEFREFLAHHRSIMSISDLGGAAEMDDAKLEGKFREHDCDGNQSLDKQEFKSYMDGVFGVLGKRKFMDVSSALIEEANRKLEARKRAYDPAVSERLVDKARGAHWVLADTEEAILQLLEKRADPNYRDASGSHTLMYCVDKAEDTFIAELLRQRADPMVHNRDLECSAFRAARARQVDILRQLLLPVAGRESRESQAAVSQQSRIAASEELVRQMAVGDATKAATLLKQGADLNFRDSSGWTPLTAAVFWGKRDVFDVLMKTQGAYTKASAKLRLNAMNGKGRPALHIAARKGRTELLHCLVRARCDIDMQDADGWTALHHAAFNGEGDCIMKLLEAGANVQVHGLHGFTAFMLQKLPTAACQLPPGVVKLLEPPEAINFGKVIMPILKDDQLTVYGKLEALWELPGIHGNPQNLRLHEQLFDVRTGPNQVRLMKLWEVLTEPIMRRLATGECDLKPLSEDPMPEQKAEFHREASARMRDQKTWLKQWLLDTRGPRPSEDWKFNNREAYGEAMYRVIREELSKFRDILDKTYDGIKNLRQGTDLVGRPELEINNPKYTSQLQAHPIPVWLQDLDAAGAFEALRSVNAASMGGDDESAMLAFIDLTTTNMDFDTGKKFWKNVYALWLSSYAKLADNLFQSKVRGLVEKFNMDNSSDDGLQCDVRGVAPKTYHRILAKAGKAGRLGHESYQARTLPANVLDVVRCSVTVKEPRAALMLIDDVFDELKVQKNKLECLRVVNRFSHECSAEDLMGYRNIELTMLLDAGMQPSACQRPGHTIHVRLIGEIQIIIEDFLRVRKLRYLLFKCSRGEFDWAKQEAEQRRQMSLQNMAQEDEPSQ